MTIRLVFSLQMLSDFHTSSGFGKGYLVDSTVLRDEENKPMVRGSSLSGLIRSASHQLLKLTADSYGTELLDAIFGTTEQKGTWAFSSARLALKRHRQRSIGLPLTQVRQGVRIDPKLRRAEDKKLFAREFGTTGLRFEFAVERAGHSDTSKDEAALIVAAARLVRGLGANVNRGAGRCLITLERVEGIASPPDQDELLEHFAALINGVERTRSLKLLPVQFTSPERPLRWQIIAQNIEPLIISHSNHIGNEYETLTYIPGTVLWGALASAYLARPENAADDEFLELFRHGSLQVSPLYPAVGTEYELRPSIPVPQDMLTCKHRPFYGHNPHNVELQGFAREATVPESCPICGNSVPLISVDGFISLAEKPRRVSTELTFLTHVSMCITERRGSHEKLYSYRAIQSGQYFAGEIQFSNGAAAASILRLMNETTEGYELTIRIGKGSTRGYGLTRIMLVPYESPLLNPTPLDERVDSIEQPITMSFISDTIMLDTWGRLASDFSSETLSDTLGLSVEVMNTFAATKEVDGFSGVAGLPKFRDLAVRAGSVVSFRVKAGPDLQEVQARLEALEARGLGLRRHEGFGLVSFNHAVYNSRTLGHHVIEPPVPWRNPLIAQDLWDELDNALAIKTSVYAIDLTKKLGGKGREVARWLYAHAELPFDELKAQLKTFGEHNALHEFGIVCSDKPSMFSDLRHELIKLLTNLLDENRRFIKKSNLAADSKEAAEVWRRSIVWLGSWIIESADKAVKEAR